MALAGTVVLPCVQLASALDREASMLLNRQPEASGCPGLVAQPRHANFGSAASSCELLLETLALGLWVFAVGLGFRF